MRHSVMSIVCLLTFAVREQLSTPVDLPRPNILKHYETLNINDDERTQSGPLELQNSGMLENKLLHDSRADSSLDKLKYQAPHDSMTDYRLTELSNAAELEHKAMLFSSTVMIKLQEISNSAELEHNAMLFSSTDMMIFQEFLDSWSDPTASCPSPFTAVGDQCLFTLPISPGSQHHARQVCQSIRGDLVTIKTATQMERIINYIKDIDIIPGFWIDGSDAPEEGNWTYSTGESFPMNTPFWGASEGYKQSPIKGAGDRNCIELRDDYHFYMKDAKCDNMNYAICEHPANLGGSAKLGENGNKKVFKQEFEEEIEEAVQSAIKCPDFYLNVGDLCLAFVTWEEVTWHGAMEACNGLGGDMASLDDIEELRELYLYIHEKEIDIHTFWLGGSDRGKEDVWLWNDGRPIPMGSPWWGLSTPAKGGVTQEPDGGLNENCLALTKDGAYYLRDKPCEARFNPLCRPKV